MCEKPVEERREEGQCQGGCVVLCCVVWMGQVATTRGSKIPEGDLYNELSKPEIIMVHYGQGEEDLNS